MSKLNYNQFLGILWIIIVIALFTGPILVYLEPFILLNDINFYLLLAGLIINATVFWWVIALYFRENINKLELGRLLEFIFFLSLFIATYTLSFIFAYRDDPLKVLDSYFLSLGFTFSLISAGSAGWLYYVEGLKFKKYRKPKQRKKRN